MPNQVQTFSMFDWNFDNVPNDELVACCLWEYARESAFIRDVRQRCIQNWRTGGHRDERLSADLGELHSIGSAMKLLTSGFYFAPGDPHRIDAQRNASVTNSFPAPWQTLPADERDFRVRTLLNPGWTPGVPFERADCHDAWDIAKQAKARWQEVFSEFDRVRREYPETSEVELTAQGKLKPFLGIPVSILREEGREVMVVAINWARFTNDEIVKHFRKWLKPNRPKELRIPDGKGRNKARDWRAKLTRLAVMRLLAHFTPLEVVDADKFPVVWKTKQFAGKQWGDITKWHDARREAGKLFRQLFPFLSPDEQPLSWSRPLPAK
jgi:hypothetical protein